jgi:DNA-directed RNA polymerase specialized sigma24 family protein
MAFTFVANRLVVEARPMPSDGSVTRWLGPLQGGDPAAARELWQRYFRRLVGLARKKLQDAPRLAADEEDVALSALYSFIRGAEEGRFPHLLDRDDLWRLLAVITARKAAHLKRDANRLKNGGRWVQQEDPADGSGEPLLEQIPSQDPSPELAAAVADECRRLLALLGDGTLRLREVAVWRMEGCTVEEIAARLSRDPRAVKRRLKLIREIWGKETGT